MQKNYTDYINAALDILDQSLQVYVEARLKVRYGNKWYEYLPVNIHFKGEEIEWDTQAILNTMIKQWSDAFQTELGYSGRNLVGELKEWRNTVAHRSAQKPITSDDAYRAVDTIWRLLSLIPLPQAQEVRAIRDELQAQDAPKPVDIEDEVLRPMQQQYTIKKVKSTPTLYHMQIYDGDIHIGDYERSGEGTFAEKSAEALQAADYLKGYYLDHGCKVAVRWNVDRKEIREYQPNQSNPGSNSRVLGEIPKRYWRKA
jgi:hypothetical protein